MSDKIKFGNPPLIEVAVSVLFSPIKNLKTAQVGFFCLELQKEFPVIEENLPLASQIEAPLGQGQPTQMHINMGLPPLRRTLLFSENRGRIIQIQQDRFVYNWKRTSDSEAYPSYENVIAEFEKYFKQFRSFLEKHGIEPLTHRQFELTYVNHISKEAGLDAVGVGGVMVDHVISDSPARRFSKPSNFAWTTTYDLADDFGRLHVIGQRAFVRPGSEPLFSLVINVRGIPPQVSEENRTKWFDAAHNHINYAFVEITSDILQKKFWKKL